MELDRIEALVTLMKEHGVAELELEDADTRVVVRFATGAVAPVVTAAAPAVVAPAAVGAAPPDVKGHTLESPMVGTFYRAPKPTSPPFCEVGDKVSKGQTLCIVEAMKLMNEIEADASGIVTEICVENAQPVQFGQPLFRIEPA